MNVLLYRVGRNLNRAYRTAEAFGVARILLLECGGGLSGNLFKAADRVVLEEITAWPSLDTALALETFYGRPIWAADWSTVRTLVIGGETAGLPRELDVAQKMVIPMYGRVSGLTVEATLAIALYEWRRHGSF